MIDGHPLEAPSAGKTSSATVRQRAPPAANGGSQNCGECVVNRGGTGDGGGGAGGYKAGACFWVPQAYAGNRGGGGPSGGGHRAARALPSRCSADP